MTITLPDGFEMPAEPEFEILVKVRVDDPASPEATVLEVDGIPVDEPEAAAPAGPPAGFVDSVEAGFGASK